MRSLIHCLTPLCLLTAWASAEAQDRFVYRPNYTALRQQIPQRTPSYDDYYGRRYGNDYYGRDFDRRYDTNEWWRHRGGARVDSSRRYNYRPNFNDQGAALVPVYEFFRPEIGDQFLTTQPALEQQSALAYYLDEGVMFYISLSGGPEMIPLYRFGGPGGHSFTTSRQGPPGTGYEGIVGYIHTSQQPGTVPLYGWYDPYVGQLKVSLRPAGGGEILGYVTAA